MLGLPLIPGYRFQDPTIEDYKLGHKFDFVNGYRVIRNNSVGIGGRPLDITSTAYASDFDPITYDPSLTYGRVREYGYQQFLPNYVLFAQKCLRFKGFFRENVLNTTTKYFRIRYVNIIYFLEDDTVTVIEPVVENAGFQQGKLVKRSKILKNPNGDFFHWKDFNVGIDICIFGITYHIYDCDPFTREFLKSQGIDVGDQEEPPKDPDTILHTSTPKLPSRINQIPDDARRRFLEYDKMILSFTATWNDNVYSILYFLADDTISIREILPSNSGKDPVTMILKRMKVPKDWKNRSSSYPSIYLESTHAEAVEYYSPKDFLIGQEICMFGRKFFLHDCDTFTRKYYSQMLGIIQPEAIPIPAEKAQTTSKFQPPPHILFGSPDDTYTSCLSLIPKPPKKDLIRQLLNFSKKLRYSMILDAVHPEDKNRDFVLEYSLSDGTITVTELPKRNSGRREGVFLKPTLIPKPNTDRDNPEYYTPREFFIGAKINIFNHHFIITDADLFVYRYIQANPDKFPSAVQENIHNYFAKKDITRENTSDQAQRDNCEVEECNNVTCQ